MRTRSVPSLPGCRLVPVASPPGCSSRNCRTRSLLSTPARGHSGPTRWPRLGSGFSSGCVSRFSCHNVHFCPNFNTFSQTSSAPSSPSTRRSSRTKLPRLRPTSTLRLPQGRRYRPSTTSSPIKRMTSPWPSSLVALPFRTSSTRLSGLKTRPTMSRGSLMRPSRG